MREFDRSRLIQHSLAEREDRVFIERDHIAPDAEPGSAGDGVGRVLDDVAGWIRSAREEGAPVVLAFGAHTIKNGLAPVLIRLMEAGWLNHLATNGAGIIHDWEFARTGQSSEHVADNVARGRFGIWEETGFYINLALAVGAAEGRGYGESVGALVENEALIIPDVNALRDDAAAGFESDPGRAAAAVDLADVIRRQGLSPGRMAVPHPWKRFSAQAAAYRLQVPFTGHPMFGHDIIYTHPANLGGAVGRTAERDFLAFADTIQRLDGGVYLSIGSAVMSPMIFEKSMSMAKNIALQEGRDITRHKIVVVDLAASDWDWSRGEPPEDHPAYYLRFNKTFSRMGGAMRYVQMDNRDFLLQLVTRLG